MIHPSAIVDPGATLGANVHVGAFSIIESDVVIGDNSVIKSHVVVCSGTRIGSNNTIYSFSTIGEQSQDKSDDGQGSFLVVGDNNIIRENCAIHRGTSKENRVTKIGNDNLIMSHCHIAHDCVLGNQVTMASYCAAAGHVHIHDGAILGGASLIHQHCHIGSFTMSAINTVIVKDVPAYLMIGGNVARERGMNYEGMRRRGYSQDQRTALRNAYRVVYRNGYTVSEALEKLRPVSEKDSNIALFVKSIKTSKRGITR